MYQRKLKSQIPEAGKPDGSKLRIIIAGFLFIVCILLVILYLNDENGKQDNDKIVSSNITGESINSSIDSLLTVLGIEKTWIKEIKAGKKNTGIDLQNLWIAKEIIIPADLTTVDVNVELTKLMRERNLILTATENPKTKSLNVNISMSNDSSVKLIGIMNFVYSDSVKRLSSDVCLVLDSLEFLSTDDAANILSSSENFTVILPLRNDKADYQSLIMESGKNYLIELVAGDENNITADLKTDMKSLTWKSKIKSICVNFPDATAVIIKDSNISDEFKNSIMNEFKNYNFKVYSDTVYKPFAYHENKVNLLLEDIINKSKSGVKYQSVKLTLTPDEFSELKSKSYSLKRAGYRFLNFKEYINKTDTVQK